ncbi:small ribosomal subunit protein uS7m-like [Branchiostoma lanceolatum]|uniref:small ribosomal subunit protein uS7m-like n=1 Tax=Branchiostoma lanceolatum TaxID=7740 RepID=UPI003452C4E0
MALSMVRNPAACQLYRISAQRRGPALEQVRTVVWHETYQEPVVDKEYYRKPEEIDDLTHTRPVRSALATQSTSVFNYPEVTKFTSYVMRKGDRAVARSIVEKSFEHLKRHQIKKYHEAAPDEKPYIDCNPVRIFHTAIDNCKPAVGVKSVKRGGKTYQVPTPLTDNRRRFLAMNWMIAETRENRDWPTQSFAKKLSSNLLEAYQEQGKVIKRKYDLHKLADANKAYGHFRFW